MRSTRLSALALLMGATAVVACGFDVGGNETIGEQREALVAAPSLIATATLSLPADLSGLTDTLENGMPQAVFGGVGSGLAWAGGTTFLGVPDRGPNATPIPNGTLNDNTTSFISRFETLDLTLTPAAPGGLPFTLTPALLGTTTLFSDTALTYGTTAGLPSAVPPGNGPGKFYFSGRSDNFGPGDSLNPNHARFDPEAIRLSKDGKSVFIADEYGPYVYQFDRLTGKRLRTYSLPSHFAIPNLNPVGATEISGNTIGRVTNKGAEGLAIKPDGNTLVMLVQSPLIQDGGDGGRANRIVTIDVASGVTQEFVYDNKIGSKAFNSSEILALNDHQFLIDTRDGKGLGDGSVAVIKQIWGVDIAGATDVSSLQGEATLLTKAVPKKLFLDLVPALNSNGIASTAIPAKIEGMAFGKDVTIGGVVTHTLFIGNDNDFIPAAAGPNLWFVFGVTDAYLASLGYSHVPQDVTELGPDLALTKTASASSVVTGGTVDFTLSVQNGGPLPADGVSVVDTLPSGLSLVGCSSATGTCSGSSVTFGSLAGAASGTATLSTAVDCSVADGTPIVNSASSSFTGTDPTPSDNTATATVTAMNPAATIANVSVDQPVLWPPNNKMNTVQVSYSVTDNCAGTVCTLSVSANEGSSSDYAVLGPNTVSLRASRNGNGPGRTYTIPVTCTDSGGRVSVATTTVVVPHDQQ